MPDPSDLPPELQLKRVLSLKEVSLLTSLSADSLHRHYAHLIRDLSPRRKGMTVEDVLKIGARESA